MSDLLLAKRGFDPETMNVAALSGVSNPGGIGDELLAFHAGVNRQIDDGGIGDKVRSKIPLYGENVVAAVCTASTLAKGKQVQARLDELDLPGGVWVGDLGEEGAAEEFHAAATKQFDNFSVVFYGAGDPLAVPGDQYAKDYPKQTEDERKRAGLVNVGSAEIIMGLSNESLAKARRDGLSGAVVVDTSLAGTKLALGIPSQFPYGGDKAKLEQDAITLARRRHELTKQGFDAEALLTPYLVALRIGAVSKKGMFVEHADPTFQEKLPSFMKVSPAQVAGALALTAYGKPNLKDLPVVSFVPLTLRMAANADNFKAHGLRGIEVSNLPRISVAEAKKLLKAV